MTVNRLVELLQKQIDEGNGHMPVGVTMETGEMNITAGLFSPARIGVTEQFDTVWIAVQGGGMKIEDK